MGNLWLPLLGIDPETWHCPDWEWNWYMWWLTPNQVNHTEQGRKFSFLLDVNPTDGSSFFWPSISSTMWSCGCFHSDLRNCYKIPFHFLNVSMCLSFFKKLLFIALVYFLISLGFSFTLSCIQLLFYMWRLLIFNFAPNYLIGSNSPNSCNNFLVLLYFWGK